MPFRLLRLDTEVPYLYAMTDRESPLFTVYVLVDSEEEELELLEDVDSLELEELPDRESFCPGWMISLERLFMLFNLETDMPWFTAIAQRESPLLTV